MRSLGGLTGICVGVAVGGAISIGSLPAAVAYFALAAALTGLLRALARTRGIPMPSAEIWFAFALRAAAAALLYGWSLETGRHGFITGDDRAYSDLAWGYVRWLQGNATPAYVPPAWDGQAYLFGGFVYLASAVYYVFGLLPLLVDFINAALSTAAILLWWDVTRRVFSARVAFVTLVVLGLDPVNVLFSALHLKDPLSLLVVALVLWSIVRFALSPRLVWLCSAAIGIALMEGVRSYLTLVLFAVTLIGVFVGPNVSRSARFAWIVSAAVMCGGTLWISLMASAASIPLPSLTSLERVRIAMAQGAHTAFSVDPPPAPAESVVLPPIAPAVSAPYPVGADTSIASATAPAAVVVPPVTLDQTPLPAIAVGLAGFGLLIPLAWLALQTRRRPTLAASLCIAAVSAGLAVAAVWIWGATRDTATTAEAASATLAYLPRGLPNVLFAPFPWAIRRSLDLATVPAMLLWYGLLVAAVRTIAFTNSRRRLLLPRATFVAGMVIVFVLGEGNVGTVFRHRAMVIGPVVAFLAAPSLLAATDWIASLRRARQPARPARPARHDVAYGGD